MINTNQLTLGSFCDVYVRSLIRARNKWLKGKARMASLVEEVRSNSPDLDRQVVEDDLLTIINEYY
jgi:hypothetical protein